MSLYTFIFSEKKQHRLIRHFTFWAGFCLLEFSSALYPDRPADLSTLDLYKIPLLSVICFTPLYIFSVYSFIYILLPRFLQRRRYGAFIGSAFIVAFCTFFAGIFLSILFFKVTGISSFLTGTNKSLAPFRTALYQGVILAFLSTGGMVTIIKLAKDWYLQQEENTKLTILKNEKEIKLLKANLQPVFLFQSLNILYKKITNDEPDAPAMVLELSELLSGILYDNDKELIPLKQELEMVHRLIHIKQLDTQTNAIKISVRGNDDKKYISPFVMFSYLQTVLNGTEIQKDVNHIVEIILEINERLSFQLMGSAEMSTEFILYNEQEIAKNFKNSIIEKYSSERISNVDII